MKRISITATLSFIIAATGLAVMIGWEAGIQPLLNLLPNQFNMVFNTALCFFIAGTSLFVTEMGWISKQKIYYISGIILVIIAGLSLLQDIFLYNFGIDQLFMKVWSFDQDAFPGRMAANTATVFTLTGLIFILNNHVSHLSVRTIIKIFITLINIIGVSALLGYILELNFLYSWYSYTRMAIHTSICATLLGITLWIIWQKQFPRNDIITKKSEKTILKMTVFVLITIALISSVLGFAVSAKQDESYIKQFLDEYLRDKTNVLDNAIKRSINEFNQIEKNIDFIKLLSDIDNSENYQKIEKLLLNSTYSAIKITDLKTNKSETKGDFIDKPQESIPLNLPFEAKIIWDGDFYLQLSDNIENNNVHKNITLQWPINAVSEFIPNKPELKKEVFLCYLNKEDKIKCLPPASLSKTAIGDLTIKSAEDLTNAIRSNSDIVIKNFGSVVNKINLAYKPIGSLKIGLIVKTNLSTIYKPLLLRLLLILIIATLLITGGYLFIKWWISPLVKKIHDSEEEFRMAFESSAAGMGLVSINGVWLRVNSALCKILGYSKNELLGNTFNNITLPDDYKTLVTKTRRLLGRKIESFDIEVRFIHKNLSTIWALLNASLVRDEKGKPEHYILQIQDITKQKEFERKLNYQARHDGLTGLVNRIELEEKINHIILVSKREERKFSIFYVDLDKFKEINDTYGHDAGDRLLKIVAERLTSCTRKSDIVCRLGGDEFVLVLTDIGDYKTAAIYAERIISSILKPIKIKNHELYVTTSIGICFFPTEGDNSEALLRSADHALYQAKEKGRNNYQFCEPNISEKIREKIAFESDLKSAIDRDEFKLFYMPQINIQTNQITGFESLLRWESTQYGFVMPEQILPIAEETGVIIPLSEWIIRTANSDIKMIQRESTHHFRLSVNISPRHFLHERMVDTILESIKYAKINPALLTLEINETLIMQNPAKSSEIIDRLKSEHVKIMIDNFGTGYSSLTFLQDIRVDFIKIDRSIVQKITTDHHRAELVSAIISLAKNIEVKVIAEGVETKEQLDFLRKHGCDEAQGFYFSQPVPKKELVDFIRKFNSPVSQ